MNDIIVVEGKNKYTFSDRKEMLEQFLGKDYSKLNKHEQYEKLRLKTLMNSTFKGIPVKDITKGDIVDNIIDTQYIIFDEETFLLSLAKNNDIVIYEKENADIFTKSINKDNLERINREYIRINDCANAILQNKIKSLHLDNKSKEKNDDKERL